MSESVWSKTVRIPERKSLSGNCDTEVAVIGAGMAGILTAYLLKQEGKEVIVLEADRVGSGQTKNTTAKITSQHGLIYSKLIKNLGVESARLYAKANENAIAAYQKLVEEKQIECHFKRVPSYLYSVRNRRALKKEAETAASFGVSAYFTEESELPFPIAGAVCFENQAQFHPLKFIEKIAEPLIIYEKTKVLSVNGHCIRTEQGRINAKHIVFATHYPITNIPGFYFLRQHQERSYVLALSGVKPIEGMYYSIDSEGLSVRMEGDELLLGGGGHRTGQGADEKRSSKKVANKTKTEGYVPLKRAEEQYYPEAEETARWSAQDCLPHDDLPLIGGFSVYRPYWHVATGFKKWGMTASMLSAMIIRDRICGLENPYEKLFTPRRLHVKAGFRKFIKDVGISTKGLVKGAFHLPFGTENRLKPGQGGIVRMGLRRYGCYRDEQGILHRISVRCPHMGCELEWNHQDKTWDCPCHGSRFDYDGELIDNPAQTDAKKKK